MTIATFCRDLLLAHGPLTADELGRLAAAGGVTRAASPRNAVMSAMQGREITLPDDRYVTPMWLLEGRCLTRDSRRSTRVDLRPAGGAVEITTIADDAVTAPEPTVVTALNRAADHRPWSYGFSTGTAVNRALAELILADDTLLRSPLPPLHTFVEALGREVRVEEETDDPWDGGFVEVRLFASFARRLERIAACEGLTSAEWVERQIDLPRDGYLQPPLRLVP